MQTPLFACIESESQGQKAKIDLAMGRGSSGIQAGPTSKYTLHRSCPLPCTLQQPQQEKSCFSPDPTLSQTLNRGKGSCQIKIHPWDATHTQANGNNAPVSQLSVGYAWEAPKRAGSFRLLAVRISTLHVRRPIPLFMPGRNESTTMPVTHLRRKEGRAGWMQEDGEPSIFASPMIPSITTCLYSPSTVPCGMPRGQQVSSFISKKCRYLSALGNPNYTLPAFSKGCGAAFDSDHREQTELCRTGGNKLICGGQRLPVARLSSC